MTSDKWQKNVKDLSFINVITTLMFIDFYANNIVLLQLCLLILFYLMNYANFIFVSIIAIIKLITELGTSYWGF